MSEISAPTVPQAAHTRDGSASAPQWRDQDDPELEATQLHSLGSTSDPQTLTHAGRQIPDTDGSQPLSRVRSSIARVVEKVEHSNLGFFWRRQVYLSVPHEKCRDHLGQSTALYRIGRTSAFVSEASLTVLTTACERTFLAYFRTASWLAMTAVMVAQLLRLNDDLQRGSFGFYRASRGLAAMLIGCAIVVVLAGAVRFWRQQNAMARDKVWSGGWELNLAGFLYGVVRRMIVLLPGIHLS